MKQQVFALVAAATLMFGAPSVAQLPAKVGETPVPSLAPVVKKAAPAVVNIATRGTVRERRPRNPLLEDPFFRRFFDAPEFGPRERQFQSAGSGVIVDAARGYVITNAHVVENADEITVTLLDDRQIKAEVVGSDRPSDIAVLKVTANNLTEMPIADSSRAEVGDFVLAIGNPFALSHTVTSGIISAVGRSDINNPESYQDFIQTDAPINPGNSGGALVNLHGELVGVNTAIFSGSGGNIGIGFAIPSNMVKAVMSQLIEHGEVKRGILGVQLANQFTPEIAESLGLDNARGALVSQVIEGSPAEKAGIRAGDVITSMNGRNIATATELRNSIGLSRVGEKIELGLMRDGKPRRVSALIGERDTTGAAGAAEIHPALEGASLTNAENGAGVLVLNVAEGSPAARHGLRTNDIILAVGRVRIGSVQQLSTAIANANAFAVTIRRGNATLVFPIG